MRIEFSTVISRTAIERWMRQYAKRGDESKDKITDALATLPNEQRTATAIAQIIGNKSWTHVFCAECRQYVDVGISFGSDPEITLCAPCLRGAEAALQATASLFPLGAPQ